ncbi:reactive intermediate/imine deaminase [Bosea sp. Root483D1]|uniref:RidA family protein n=1 Tax=Bosea sp. Root483D1 TaxID=1736544 RepID=UPI00070CA7A6|nr:RidA family protein [Bosea sp. Root483D1]KRE11577.1 reactive intermediate/imine deaminase [Bosea sp. Root483D1]
MPAAIAAVATENAPAPFGHYVQTIVADGFVFISGQLASLADGTMRSDADFEAQARQSLDNLLAIAAAAGAAPERIVKVTAYIVGAEHWPAFDHVFAEAFGAHRPARSVVPVPALHHGYLIEIEAIARL